MNNICCCCSSLLIFFPRLVEKYQNILPVNTTRTKRMWNEIGKEGRCGERKIEREREQENVGAGEKAIKNT